MTETYFPMHCGGVGAAAPCDAGQPPRSADDDDFSHASPILGMPVSFGLGFAVGGGLMPNPNTLYWGGAGGSLAVIDMDLRATYAYSMNKMGGGRTGDMRAFAPISAAWDALASARDPALG